MNFQEIKNCIISRFGETAVLKEYTELMQPQLTVSASLIADICRELRDNEKTYFDFLSCLTGVDNGPQAGTMEILYHLYSIPYNHHIVLRTELVRNRENEPLPSLPSITPVYHSANWHEREAYDFFGIVFEGHPDLRRILLPTDWEGFPLRKDYKQQDYYHGIKVEY